MSSTGPYGSGPMWFAELVRIWQSDFARLTNIDRSAGELIHSRFSSLGRGVGPALGSMA